MPGATLHLSDEMNEGWRREGEGGGREKFTNTEFCEVAL